MRLFGAWIVVIDSAIAYIGWIQQNMWAFVPACLSIAAGLIMFLEIGIDG